MPKRILEEVVKNGGKLESCSFSKTTKSMDAGFRFNDERSREGALDAACKMRVEIQAELRKKKRPLVRVTVARKGTNTLCVAIAGTTLRDLKSLSEYLKTLESKQ